MTEAGSKILLAEMTSAQVLAELGRGRSTVVVPFGAVEQHGPHLPLDTDAVLADRLLGEERPDVGVAAAAGAEDRRPDREVVELCLSDPPQRPRSPAPARPRP